MILGFIPRIFRISRLEYGCFVTLDLETTDFACMEQFADVVESFAAETVR